eukprot:1161233-Pelagomonas_calceolata.AAC.11
MFVYTARCIRANICAYQGIPACRHSPAAHAHQGKRSAVDCSIAASEADNLVLCSLPAPLLGWCSPLMVMLQ